MSIVIFGSINMDLVVRSPRLPTPGETLTGHTFFTAPGGKGANQAVACARLGAETKMIGRVGDDLFGEALIESLASSGVDASLVTSDANIASGVALITLDDEAENNIIVVPGANGTIGEEDLKWLDLALNNARLLLIQLEIPLKMVLAAAKIAKRKRVITILDPAPVSPLPNELYPSVDILTPNETEVSQLVGFPVDEREQVEQATKILLARGVNLVIIKLGAQGAYAANKHGGKFYPAIPVTAIDTVAAGDAFNGALATALSEGNYFEEAVRWGLAGGALAVTKEGAQNAMPTRGELMELLEKQYGI